MERPQIEDYNTGSYDGLLGYCKDLDRFIDYIEICQKQGIDIDDNG